MLSLEFNHLSIKVLADLWITRLPERW